MKPVNKTHIQLLCGINDLVMDHANENHEHVYDKGWNDAMARAETLINSVFAGQHDQSPQDNRLDAVIAQQDAGNIRNDPVNHPSHYTDGIEVIDYIESKGFPYHLGNAIKYISRAGKKNPARTEEDLQKAVWYINRYIDLLKKREAVSHAC